ncbi:MAG: thiamine pyrophosphate-binding protein [Verrucomicrobiota bacterium]
MDTTADILARWLNQNGHQSVFSVPGLQIDPIWLNLINDPLINLITATHEAAAGFMADGYARKSRDLGVCLSIGSVGLANLAIAILTAKSDNSPVMFITGEPPAHLNGFFPFQDTSPQGSHDQAYIKPLIKRSFQITNLATMASVLDQARSTALSYPRGPVHVSIPFGLPHHTTVPSSIRPRSDHDLPLSLNRDISVIIDRLRECQNAVALIGYPNLESQTIQPFLENYLIPFATTLGTKGLISESHPLSLGNFGFAGSSLANEALLRDDIDLLLCLGVTFGERNTLNWSSDLFHNRDLIAIGCQESGHEPSRSTTSINHNPAIVLRELRKRASALQPLKASSPKRATWLSNTFTANCHIDVTIPRADDETIDPNGIMSALRRLPESNSIVIDAGSARTLFGKYWECHSPHTFFSSAATGSMGWSLGAAAGIALAGKKDPVTIVIGDGSLLMYGNELRTLKESNTPAVIVLLNNSAYGSIHKRCENDQTKQDASLQSINWAAYAASFNIEYRLIERADDMKEPIDRFISNWHDKQHSPMLLDVRVPIDWVPTSDKNGYNTEPYSAASSRQAPMGAEHAYTITREPRVTQHPPTIKA